MRVPALWLLLAVLAGSEPPSWTYPDLPADPEVAWGRLDNGLVYAVRSHPEPKGKLSIRAHVRVGSVQEQDAEQGLAHYLEHLAFQGSKNFPAGCLIDRLQQIGIAHGSHSNAHTSFEETVYKLDLPDLAPATLELGFLAVSDMVGRLDLLEDRINNERGVIRAEMRDRDDAGHRVSKKLYPALLPGLLHPRRFPIGLAETVDAMDRALIAGFYQRWYRPDRIMVSVVGDLEASQLRELVSRYFADLPPAAGEPQHPDYGALESFGDRVVVFSDPELGRSDLRLAIPVAEAEPRDSGSFRRDDLLRDLGAMVLGRRFAEIAQTGTAAIDGGQAGYYYWLEHRLATVGVTVKPGRETEAVRMLDQELRRLLEHPPTAGEVGTVVKEYRAGLERTVAQAANRTQVSWATELYAAWRDQRTVADPQQWLAFYAPLLDAADPAAVHAAFRACWSGPDRCLALTGKGPYPPELEAQLADTWRDSASAPVAAKKEVAAAVWAYGEPGPADLGGKSVQERGQGVRSISYGNGVQLHVLARKDKPNEVLMRASLHLPPAPLRPGVAEWFGRSVQASALGRHEAVELLRLFAGLQSSLQAPHLGDDVLAMGSSGPPGELGNVLQFLRASLIDLGWREPIYAMQQQALVRDIEAGASDIDQQSGRLWQLLATGGDPRRAPSAAEAAALRMGDVRDYVAPVLATAPLEVAIVGDVDPAQVEAEADRWLAALPPRQPVPVQADLTLPGALRAGAPPILGRHQVELTGQVDRTVLRLAWPTDDNADIGFRRRMQMLGMVLAEAVRKGLREEMGETYSPWAGHDGSLSVDGRGMLLVHAAVAPEQMAKTETAVRAIVARLLADGIAVAELDFVRLPLLKGLDAQLTTNAYWLRAVDRCGSRPQQLDWAGSIRQGLESITAAELDGLARKYLAGEPLLMQVTCRTVKTAP